MKFPLGQCVATPGALKALEESNESAIPFLRRHAAGDWGDVCADDAQANEDALKLGARLLSSYRTTKGTRLWVITEADREVTTVLLPEEY